MSDETCRICFSPENLLSIYIATEDGLISEKITKLANVEISPEDGLPQYVCDECSVNLNCFIKFKQQIEESDEYLRNSLNLSDVPDELIIDWQIEADESQNSVDYGADSVQKTDLNKCSIALSDSTVNKIRTRKKTVEDPSGKDSSMNECNVYASRVRLKYHRKSHNGNKRFQCDFCSKSFKSSYNLRVHRRLHTGEKPYTCEFCYRSFAQSAGLAAHQRLHTGEHPFQCGVCSKEFKTSSHLKYHIAQQHTGDKPHACEMCDKSFAAKGDLVQHKKIHTGEKTFTCSICSRSFLRGYHLERHMLTHSKDKKFKCEICCRAFSQKYDLKRHIKIHNQE